MRALIGFSLLFGTLVFSPPAEATLCRDGTICTPVQPLHDFVDDRSICLVGPDLAGMWLRGRYLMVMWVGPGYTLIQSWPLVAAFPGEGGLSWSENLYLFNLAPPRPTLVHRLLPAEGPGLLPACFQPLIVVVAEEPEPAKAAPLSSWNLFCLLLDGVGVVMIFIWLSRQFGRRHSV